MAYATSPAKGTTVVTSCESLSRSARMLKRAIMAGLNVAGVNVFEPRGGVAARHAVPGPLAAGGRGAVRAADDAESVVVRFFDSSGADISEDAKRKIERRTGG